MFEPFLSFSLQSVLCLIDEQGMPYLGSSDICPFHCHLYWILTHLEGRIYHWQAPHTLTVTSSSSSFSSSTSSCTPISSPNSPSQDFVHDAKKLQCKLKTSQGFLGTFKSAQFQPKFQGFAALVMAKPKL